MEVKTNEHEKWNKTNKKLDLEALRTRNVVPFVKPIDKKRWETIQKHIPTPTRRFIPFVKPIDGKQ